MARWSPKRIGSKPRDCTREYMFSKPEDDYIMTEPVVFPEQFYDSRMKDEGPMLGERGLEAAEKYSTAFLKRSTLSSIRDWKERRQSVMSTARHRRTATVKGAI